MIEMPVTLMDPKVDFAFKQVFAGNSPESKIVLLALLNAVLDRDEDEQITDIVHLNPYTDKPFADAKQSIMDIKVKTGGGELVDIEIQIRNSDNYRKRSLYYWSAMYGEQIVEGESYFELNPCIVINILDFDLIKENEHYHSVFDIRERQRGFQLVGDLEIHYLELSKLSGYMENASLTGLEEWLIFIKEAANAEKRELIERIKERNEVIAMAEKILAHASADEFARAAYQQRRKWHLDQVSSEKYLLKQGLEQGIEQGIAQGIAQGIKQGIEQGIEEGKKEGKKEGQTDILLRQLGKRFGPLPGDVEEGVRKLPDEKLAQLAEAIFDLKEMEDVLTFLEA